MLDLSMKCDGCADVTEDLPLINLLSWMYAMMLVNYLLPHVLLAVT